MLGWVYLVWVYSIVLVLFRIREYFFRALSSSILVVRSLLLGSWYSSCSFGTIEFRVVCG